MFVTFCRNRVYEEWCLWVPLLLLSGCPPACNLLAGGLWNVELLLSSRLIHRSLASPGCKPAGWPILLPFMAETPYIYSLHLRRAGVGEDPRPFPGTGKRFWRLDWVRGRKLHGAWGGVFCRSAGWYCICHPGDRLRILEGRAFSGLPDIAANRMPRWCAALSEGQRVEQNPGPSWRVLVVHCRVHLVCSLTIGLTGLTAVALRHQNCLVNNESCESILKMYRKCITMCFCSPATNFGNYSSLAIDRSPCISLFLFWGSSSARLLFCSI